ncbi:S24 family peptidase [Janthinobacterium sp. SUN137]|uniref:S24 family peptidase n=1 Tax=Janthinobacterium sp. SUN137 TaxID=3014789 RepID=UPI002713B2B0|nr:S24 family peptidase [Janthinobacterium sp. SUN137]MDO8039464.1 S24 family peptidase [Janthinobacterium sp. SUN137]
MFIFLVVYLFVKLEDHHAMTREEIRRENARSLADLAGGQVEFGRALNMVPSQVSQIIGKTPIKNIGNSIAKRIEQAFEKPAGWLDVLHNDIENADAGSALDARPVTGDDDMAPVMVSIRMVPEHLRAGITGFETDHLFEDGGHLHVPRQWLEENDLTPDQLRAIKVKGDSMVPMLYAGDVAVVNIKDKSRVSGGVFALNYKGESVVKRLRYDRREWYLTSENPDFREEPCRTGDCNVIGRVVRFEPRNFKDRL